MRFKIIFITSFLFIVLSFYGKTEAEDKMLVPPRVQIPILFKILTYDRNFEGKIGDSLIIGILYNSQDTESRKAKKEISDVLDSLSAKTVKNVPFNYVILDYSSEKSLGDLIDSNGIDVLYLAPGGQRCLKSIVQISQKVKILTMTGITDYVKEGISLGIGLKENKPEIWVNLDSTKAEGSDFDANFLKLCEIIRKSEI
jgi:hypothetical protein